MPRPPGGDTARELPSDGPAAVMPAKVQAQMERAFGADFSAVRIHEEPRASAMGALAYTQGTDLHFAPGQYDPHSPRGQELLGHELAHVVQQAQGRVPATAQASGASWNGDAGLEHEADQLGSRAARGEPARTGALVVPAAATRSPVQARLPAQNYEHDVRQHAPDEQSQNLQGLQNLLVRLYTYDLSGDQQALLQSTCNSNFINLPAALYAAPSGDTHHVYNWVCKLFPAQIYPGHQAPSTPQDKTEQNNREELVAKVREVVAWMSGSGSEGDLTLVFGPDHIKDVRDRIANTSKWVSGQQFSESIKVDRTRESEEMMIGGRASFQGTITLRHDALANPPGNDLVARVVHESFHAANEDVLDDGGYPSSPDDFKQKSPRAKMLNASHYEEVARRYLGASPVGGEFKPAVRTVHSGQEAKMEVDDRTPLQQASDRVRHTLQIAWERSQNVHGWLKSLVHEQHARNDKDESGTKLLRALEFWSNTLHLQLHDRLAQSRTQEVVVNYIDLLQVETLTKSLAKMMGEDLTALLTKTPIGAQDRLKLSDEKFAGLIADSLLDVVVNRHSDARWLKPDTFKSIVEALSTAPRDVRNV